ncbi:hypothetical protein HAX54_031034 [Datura stramonium]|uniref:Uncharacterized protein n=1 Tax=Datura stramonium TaxID=4076 RepID=A0ABS8SBQ5_DATST|nr:hypothetical protein [Datura stramonium]
MLVSCQDTGENINLLYGMIISRTLKDIEIDLSNYLIKEASSTYDNLTFTSIGFFFFAGKWLKKAGFKPNIKVVVEEIPSIINSSDALKVSVDSLLKEVLKIKVNLGATIDGLHKI